MTLWFDPAAWRKRVGTPAANSGCTPRDPATVATGMEEGGLAEEGNCPVTATGRSVESLSVATVAMSQGLASADTAILLSHDVLERAAILEFCEGLTRREADVLALVEFGRTSWKIPSPTLGDVCPAAPPLEE